MNPAGAFRLPCGSRLAVTASSADAALVEVEALLAAGRGFALATLNLDHLVKLRSSEAFRRAYLATDIVTADGRPVVWLSRLAGRPARLAAGSDLVRPLAAVAARLGAPVALFGGDDDTLERAGAALASETPGLRIVLRLAPPYGFDPESPFADACAARIAQSGARLCFVALGAPKQEIFAIRARATAPACGFVSVGAGLDFLAGVQQRAPAWMRRLALEWAWRMALDPRRLAGRYAACAAALPGLALDAIRLRADLPVMDPARAGRR